MISDALFDAVQDIKGYLDDFPETYSEVREEIDALVERMDAMRAKLDAPPKAYA